MIYKLPMARLIDLFFCACLYILWYYLLVTCWLMVISNLVCLAWYPDVKATAHDSSPGPDLIHYQILKHLPYSALQLLLTILNKYWLTDTFPSTWHKAIIIPVPEPGKDSENPNNYRPIALTSCRCKTFERTINNLLMLYLEKHKLISPIQNGFRKTEALSIT